VSGFGSYGVRGAGNATMTLETDDGTTERAVCNGGGGCDASTGQCVCDEMRGPDADVGDCGGWVSRMGTTAGVIATEAKLTRERRHARARTKKATDNRKRGSDASRSELGSLCRPPAVRPFLFLPPCAVMISRCRAGPALSAAQGSSDATRYKNAPMHTALTLGFGLMSCFINSHSCCVDDGGAVCDDDFLTVTWTCPRARLWTITTRRLCSSPTRAATRPRWASTRRRKCSGSPTTTSSSQG